MWKKIAAIQKHTVRDKSRLIMHFLLKDLIQMLISHKICGRRLNYIDRPTLARWSTMEPVEPAGLAIGDVVTS